MGKKLAFSSLFSISRDSSSSSPFSPWPWPSCKHPRTHSFRAGLADDSVFKTVNSVYLDSAKSCLTFTSGDPFSESFSTASSMEDDYSRETLIRGLRSDRLFFDGGDQSPSIVDEASKPRFKESFALAMESEDPYRDFRASMEEMVVANEIRDWESLEELLVWYLRINGKKTHAYILGAFVDLLVGLASANFSSSDTSFDNCSSSTSSSPAASTSTSSSFKIEEEIVEEDEQKS